MYFFLSDKISPYTFTIQGLSKQAYQKYLNIEFTYDTLNRYLRKNVNTMTESSEPRQKTRHWLKQSQYSHHVSSMYKPLFGESI